MMESMDLPSSETAGLACGFWATSAREKKSVANTHFTASSGVIHCGQQPGTIAEGEQGHNAGRGYWPWLGPANRELRTAAAGFAKSQEAVTYITKHSTAKGRKPR